MNSLHDKDGESISSPGGTDRVEGEVRPPAKSREAIQAWLVSQVAATLKLDPAQIDPRQSFAFYGLDSIDAVGLSNDLEEFLGRTLPPTLAWDHPSVESLARWLVEGDEGSQAKTQIDEVRAAGHEPVAIIGIGCRFPGGVVDTESFWQLLRNGVDAITEVPPDRWDAAAFYDPRAGIRGKMNTRWGGFLDRIDEFDPLFFGVTTREAGCIDPQQRLLLEVAWEALVDAGLAPHDLAGTRAGVFVGLSSNDYWNRLQSDLANVDAYMTPGGALSIAANRISYFFDFHGPSIVVDTACSSSLVAVDLACRSILSGQSQIALAGGANLILSPAVAISFSQGMATSPDGRCRAFDARANGMVRSEGVGLIVLKAFSQALADGDPIYALILGSAVNQDGRTNGIASPSQSAQEAVLREAYLAAGVSPGQIQYVDAHGTGTLLGDPIEAKALGNVLADGRPPGKLCAIGSVKSNLGHLEAAAGIASLIKVALAFKHKEIPPSLHFQEPNPHIPFAELSLYVQQTLGPWPAASGPALAGVSGFGFGGTNAHVVLQAFAPDPSVRASVEESGGQLMLLPLSAHSPNALSAVAKQYEAFLAGEHEEAPVALRDVCYTASTRLSHHDYRAALLARSREDCLELLRAFINQQSPANLWSGQQSAQQQAKIVFVFSGQGVPLTGAGRQLYAEERVFREALEECEAVIKEHTGYSVKEILLSDRPETEQVAERTDLTQLALFALQVGLAELWQQWGITPAAVIGHSVGEVAAARVAGVLSLADAVRVVSARGSLMQQALERPGERGAMAAVKLTREAAERALSGYEDRLSVAAHNSQSAVVLSGEAAALKEVLHSLQQEKISSRWLTVPGAGHSPGAEPLRLALSTALEGLQPKRSQVPIFSTVTGRAKDGSEFDAAYWGSNVRDTVRFADAIAALIDEGHDTFLEISVHPLLTAAISQGLNHRRRKGLVLGSLRRREEDPRASMLGTLAALYTRGCAIDWKRLYGPAQRAVRLPSYPWQRERFWLKERRGSQAVNSQTAYAQSNGGPESGHPLLHRHLRSSIETDTHFWETEISASLLSYLPDHRVQGTTLFPAAAYLEMALSAAVQSFGAGSYALEQVSIERPLPLSARASSTLQLVLRREDAEQISFKFSSASRPGEGQLATWTLHAAGTLRNAAVAPAPTIDEQSAPKVVRARCQEFISAADFYRTLAEHGGQYGPSFQNVEQIWRRSGEALGQLQMVKTLAPEADLYQIHPALLDACFQMLAAALPQDEIHPAKGESFLPVGLKAFRLFSHPQASTRFWCHARVHSSPTEHTEIEGDVLLLDEIGRPVLEALGLRARPLNASKQSTLDDWFYEITWHAKSLPQNADMAAEADQPASWLVFTDGHSVGQGVEAWLRASGAACVTVSPGEEYFCSTPERYRINPARPQDFQRLFEAAFTDPHRACLGVIHILGVDAAGAESCSLPLLDRVREFACDSLLHAVQALVRLGSNQAPRLWVVTSGANSVLLGVDSVAVAQTPLLGLVKAIALEHPEFRCSSVDLSAQGLPEEIENLVRELSLNQPENQIALRGTERFVARLTRRSLRPDQEESQPPLPPQAQLPLPSDTAEPQPFRLNIPIRFRSDGAYLITGGLGGLGLTVAGWMAAHGARHFMLLGRHLPSPAVEQVLANLRAAGSQVEIAQADVSQPAEVGRVLKEIKASMPRLRGVIHSASVLDDGILVNQTAERFKTVWEPKVSGAWNLHEQTQEDELDFFVMFSSAASVLGSPGQGNYVTANAFLDGLAHYRHGRGLPGLSINWGPWSEVGGAALIDRGGRLAARGAGSIHPAQGVEALGLLLSAGATQTAVMPFDLGQWSKFYPKAAESSSLLIDLLGEQNEVASDAGSSLRQTLLAVEPEQRQRLLQTYLQEQMAQVLGFPPEQIGINVSLGDLGFDSLVAVEVKGRLEASLDLTLSPTLIWNYPTVAELARYLLEQMEMSLTPPDVGPEKQPGADLDQLSPAELADLLAMEIANAAERNPS